MDISLHAATEQVRALLDQIDPETGEIPDGFDQARALVATKAVAVTAYIIETERQAEMVADYAKELLARVKSSQRRVEWLRTYLREHMSAAGVMSISDERGLFSAKLEPGRDKAVDVFDAEQLPEDYLREIPARSEPDKTLIARAIKSGFDVPGARVVTRDRLTIR